VTRCDAIRIMGWDRLIEYLGEVWKGGLRSWGWLLGRAAPVILATTSSTLPAFGPPELDALEPELPPPSPITWKTHLMLATYMFPCPSVRQHPSTLS